MDLTESIQEWVAYDNQIKAYSAKIKTRSKKNN